MVINKNPNYVTISIPFLKEEVTGVKTKYGIVVAVYRSPERDGFRKFIDKLEEAFDWLTAEHPNTILF